MCFYADLFGIKSGFEFNRYMYFHQLLLETSEKVFFSESQEMEKTRERFGKWLFAQYLDNIDVDEELAAEICYQLMKGNSFDLLLEYLKQKHVNDFE